MNFQILTKIKMQTYIQSQLILIFRVKTPPTKLLACTTKKKYTDLLNSFFSQTIVKKTKNLREDLQT